jgi:hypothetical protein
MKSILFAWMEQVTEFDTEDGRKMFNKKTKDYTTK